MSSTSLSVIGVASTNRWRVFALLPFMATNWRTPDTREHRGVSEQLLATSYDQPVPSRLPAGAPLHLPCRSLGTTGERPPIRTRASTFAALAMQAVARGGGDSWSGRKTAMAMWSRR